MGITEIQCIEYEVCCSVQSYANYYRSFMHLCQKNEKDWYTW